MHQAPGRSSLSAWAAHSRTTAGWSLPLAGAMFMMTWTGVWGQQLQGPDDQGRWSQQPSRPPAAVRQAPSSTVEVPARRGDGAPADADRFARFREGAKPQWIWAPQDLQACFLRKGFELEDQPGGRWTAHLMASCDNQMEVWLNGRRVARSGSWESPVVVDVTPQLRAGANELLVNARNEGGPSGFVCKLVLSREKLRRELISDGSWEAAASREAEQWVPARSLAALGGGAWGDIYAKSTGSAAGLLPAIPRDVFQTLPGFEVELLLNVDKQKMGSWVAMAFDPKGRIVASDQGGQGLWRITPAPLGSDEPTRVEKLDVPMTSAQGLLFAFDSLYVSVNGGPGSGLYRLRDTTGDDQFDQVERLMAVPGGGEHGPHALRLSPDGKSIYMIAGNHTNLPDDVRRGRMPLNWQEDLLLPRQWDARGHARGRLAPGGWICRISPDAKDWEVFSMGYRNPYDMDFSPEGELFAYDADMEWDMGTPWYRPTRLVHATSGSEFGWRSGTGKWPTWYPDSLPQVVDIGPGSPTGVTFGTGAKFPARYQRAVYLLDWTFGTMYAVHLTPSGSSYVGEREEFLSRAPLPLTDAAVGPDGALYFTVGGRGTESALYRVTYRGPESTAPAGLEEGPETRALRELRHRLERFHSPNSASDEELQFIIAQLGNDDRHVRFAARIALEQQERSRWQERALQLVQPQSVITASLALARSNEASLLGRIVDQLAGLEFPQLTTPQRLEYLRALALTFARLGAPDEVDRSRLVQLLDPCFPADSNPLNRELCQLLVYLNSPTVVEKTMQLIARPASAADAEIPEVLARNAGYGGTIAKMLSNQPDLQKLHYAFVLRNVRFGWTLDQRKEYLKWLDAAGQRSGGASYQGFLANIRKEALENASEQERAALESVVPPPKLEELPKPLGPGQPWTTDQILKLAESGLSGRNFERGQRAFAAAQCVRCHRFAGQGGATGPDLTNTAGRFSLKDLVEAITEPSKVISDQYQASTVVTASGKTYTGRILGETDGKLSVLTDPVDATQVIEIARDDVEAIQPSKISLMPAKLADPLGRDELLDLLAYLLSRGNPQDRLFQAAP